MKRHRSHVIFGWGQVYSQLRTCIKAQVYPSKAQAPELGLYFGNPKEVVMKEAMAEKRDENFYSRKAFLVLDYIESRIFFDKLYKDFSKDETKFEDFEVWIGTEAKKGSFWLLKDESHQIYRDRADTTTLEGFFYFMISQIFHIGMVLKEYTYCYNVLTGEKGERHASIFEKYKDDFDRSKILVEPLEMRVRLFNEMENLFKIGNKFLVEDLLPSYKDNKLLTRRLVLERQKFTQALPEYSLEDILAKMHGDIKSAYLVAAQSLQADGYLREARKIERKMASMRKR